MSCNSLRKLVGIRNVNWESFFMGVPEYAIPSVPANYVG
jgi:hypothetical protein